MSLEEYHKKRNFDQTSEPEGTKEKSQKKLTFVVQRHAASRLHYDFRLEIDGVLKSWAVPKGPSLNPADKRLAMLVEDHPMAYGTFEGTIPKGNYGAGEVEIWDSGTYEPIRPTKISKSTKPTKSAKPVEKTGAAADNQIMQQGLQQQSLKFILYGDKLKGEFALLKIKNQTEDNAWLLIKHNDEFAVQQPYDAENFTEENSKVTAYLRSKSKKLDKKLGSNRNIHFPSMLRKAQKLNKFIRPMLCKQVNSAFDDEEWAFEIKWDGYRAIADLRGENVRLYSRNGLDFTNSFKKISNLLSLQQHEMVLDGELVAYDDTGKPNFQWLQQINENRSPSLVYQIFDLLWLNGHSTKELTYLQRKELLKSALIAQDQLQYHDHIIGKGKSFFEAAKAMGLEGIIAKKTDSTYKENVRSSEWVKIKIQKTDEVIICGFTEPKGSRFGFGSLILGKYLNDELVFCGHAGTGFSDADLHEIVALMKPLVTSKCPFSTVPKTNAKPTWIQPKLVAEIKFTEITQNNIYRHPAFMRMRMDKDAREVHFPKDKHNTSTNDATSPTHTVIAMKPSQRDQAATSNKKGKVKLTNQQKIYFPDEEITKGDIIAYYQAIANYILPHLKNRPQSLNRHPNGIDGDNFYQKDAVDLPNWVLTHPVVSESTDKIVNYIVCNDKETLAYINNLGCIELNTWNSTIENPEHPDYLVLDLDPSAKNTFEDVIEVAQVVKEVLDLTGTPGYPKTSGSTGIHIYIPTNAQYDYEQVKNFGHLLMGMVQTRLPELTTLERSLKKRDKNKVYLDYLQNRRGQTLASVYSVRPKPGAPVSMPLHWNEIKSGLKPTDFTIFNALDRLKREGDIFQPVLEKGIDMRQIVDSLEP